METDLEHFDFIRILKGDHTGELAEYHGLKRDQTNSWVSLVMGREFIAVPFGGFEKVSVEDFSPEESAKIAREWIGKFDDPTFCYDDFSDDELLDGEGGAGAILCARDELDALRHEPIVIQLFEYHMEVPAVATLLGKLLGRNESLLREEKRMENLRTLRYQRIWGSEPTKGHRDPRPWMVDNGGLCP